MKNIFISIPYKKIGIVVIIFFLVIFFTPAKWGNSAKVVKAANIKSFPEAYSSAIIPSINMLCGQIISGNYNLLSEKDQEYIKINSTLNETSQEASFYSEINFDASKSCVNSIKINLTTKSSIEGTIQNIYLYNYNTCLYEKVKSIDVGTSDTDCLYLNEDNNSITSYVSDTNKMKIKISMTNSSSFIALIDSLNIFYDYNPQNINRIVSTYNMDNCTLEYGTVSANNSSYLKNMDSMCFSVASNSNKVAWNSQVTLNQNKNDVKTLIINYSGNYSINCNNTWMSLWNYQTGNWEVITNFISDTTTKNIKWATSDPNEISKFISESNDVKVRLYNSSSSSYIRNSDYLNVTVYYDTQDSFKVYSPDNLKIDYGTVTSGDINSVSSFDNKSLVMSSDENNKIAWECGTKVDIEKQYIKSVNIMTRVKSSDKINNLNFSLWNYNSGKWEVKNEHVGTINNENLIITITDPDDIDKYVSSDGQIQARLYNSSKVLFERDTDIITFCVEYGSVGTFEFAQLSDIHEFTGENNFHSVINDLNNNIKPDFTVITGDISDHGTPEQFNQYLSDLALLNGIKYTSTGNHDVRWWTSNGKNDWKDKIGPLYYSFNHKGVHFVVMDSTVTFNLDEKFGKAQLKWLSDDLSKISTSMPVIIFAHHPFHMYNNVTGIHELTDVIKNYNVVAYISGHQHYYGKSIENGITWEFTSDIKDDPTIPFCTVKITPNKLYIYKMKESDHTKTLWITAPIMNNRKADAAINSAIPQSNGNVDINVSVKKSPDGVSKIQARIDNYGPWTTLSKDGDNWTGTIDISSYSPQIPYGKHFAEVYMTDMKGNVWKEYKDYNWDGGNVNTKWTFETGDIIQSSPTYFNGVVYVGSEDGKVYAINDNDGSLKWSYTTNDQIISKPAIYQGTDKNLVLIGSNDKKLYALNADTGNVEWTYTTGGSVISDILVDNGTAYFGSGDKYIYAVNVNDGSIKWKYLTKGLMRQKPLIYNGKLYAFVRDTSIWYAININDGSLYWKGNAATDESMWVCGDVRPILAQNKIWCIDAQNKRAGYLNPDTGNLDWYSSVITNASSRGMAADGTRVFYVSNEGRQVYALDSKNNSQSWYKDLRAGESDSDLQESQIDSGLICEDGILYHTADRGRITGFDAATGDIKFVYDACGYPERNFWSTPEVHDKTVYIGGLDGKLYAVKYNGN